MSSGRLTTGYRLVIPYWSYFIVSIIKVLITRVRLWIVDSEHISSLQGKESEIHNAYRDAATCFEHMHNE